MLRGRRQTLLRQLGANFGPLAEAVRSLVEGIADGDELDRLADRVLTAQTLAEMDLPRA